MSHPIFSTGQGFTPLHFDVVGHCFVAERHAGADDRAAHELHGEPRSSTLLPFLSLLLGIAVSSDEGHAS